MEEGYLEEHNFIDEVLCKKQAEVQAEIKAKSKYNEALNITAKALVSALLGLLLSAIAMSVYPVEVDLDRSDEFARKVEGVNSARRFTKPAIHIFLGYGAMSIIATALASLLLLVAIMAKSWSGNVACLAVPAVLLLAAELVSDASDALVAAFLIAMAGPGPIRALLHAVAATIMIATEAIIWYFIAKYLEFTYSGASSDNEIESN